MPSHKYNSSNHFRKTKKQCMRVCVFILFLLLFTMINCKSFCHWNWNETFCKKFVILVSGVHFTFNAIIWNTQYEILSNINMLIWLYTTYALCGLTNKSIEYSLLYSCCLLFSYTLYSLYRMKIPWKSKTINWKGKS